jgi:predicted PurR-regulated permease PerM
MTSNHASHAKEAGAPAAHPSGPAADGTPTLPTSRPRASTFELTIIAVLAVLYTAYFARAFLIPVAIAMLLNLLLSPVIRKLARWHLPPPLGAGLVIGLLAGGIAYGAYRSAGPAQRWVATAPQTLRHAEQHLRSIIRPVSRVATVASQVEQATEVNAPPGTQQVVVRGPGFGERLFGTTQAIVTGLIEIVLLLYFMLASGDLYLQKTLKMLPRTGDRAKAISLAHTVEASVSQYLLTTAAIYASEGIAVAVVLGLLGMPTPELWGALAAALAFIPYLGAVTMTAVLTIAGLTIFTNTTHALLIPAAYFAIDFIQGNLVTPLIMSRRLTLNPVAVFVALAFWWWAWGVSGAFLAVPMLAVFKIVCDHIERLAPIGEFLAGRDPEERRALVRLRKGWPRRRAA